MSVTVLLTLKGRPLHTLRWFWYANQIKLPFKILVADGGDDEIVVRTLSRPELFPNLDYRYVRYNDRVLADYWFKLADAVRQIDTPYMMLADNDDFILPTLVAQARDFLDANADYVCAGGALVSFSVAEQTGARRALDSVTGEIYSATAQACGHDYDSADPVERVRQYFRHRYPLFYQLTRREAFLEIFEKDVTLNFSNFDLWEHHNYLSLALSGKVKFLPGTGYLRQEGTSQSHAGNRGLAYNLVYRGWGRDLQTAITSLTETACAHGLDGNAFDGALRDLLVATFSHSQMRPPVPAPSSGPRQRLRTLPLMRQLYWRRSHRRLVRHFAQTGADAAYLGRLDAEIAAVRACMADDMLAAFIEATTQRSGTDGARPA
jgi:glycosyltransferase domain-containing protein